MEKTRHRLPIIILPELAEAEDVKVAVVVLREGGGAVAELAELWEAKREVSGTSEEEEKEKIAHIPVGELVRKVGGGDEVLRVREVNAEKEGEKGHDSQSWC